MTFKKNVYVFVFDGYADWEASYAMVGIIKSKHYHVRTIAIDKDIKKSMAGLSIVPDFDFLPADLRDIDNSNTAMLILPGGGAWERGQNRSIAPLVKHCAQEGIPVAAICAATVFLADLGILDSVFHTSNDPGYLSALSQGYTGHELYQYKPSVSSDGIITAGGTFAIEFAASIFDALDIYDQDNTRKWFQFFDKMLV
jgi:putative intracellular protease/amidase